MKKRIFIAIHYLEIGGAEMSLIGLLQSFDYSKVEVDLFVYRHQGEFVDDDTKGSEPVAGDSGIHSDRGTDLMQASYRHQLHHCSFSDKRRH